MKNVVAQLLAILLSLLSGLLVALAFPPWNLEWLIWVALTPILGALLLFKLDWRSSVFLGALFGAGFGGITFSWLAQSGRVAEWFWNVGSIAVVGAIWASVVTRFVELPIRKSERTEKVRPILPGNGSTPEAWRKSIAHLRAALLTASVWTVLEWARGVLLPGWNTLGVSLQINLPLLQMATVTGASGLSFTIVFANLIVLTTLRRLILEPGRMSWASRFDVTATLGGIFLIAVGGFWSLRPAAGKTSLTVGLLTSQSAEVSELISKCKSDQSVDLWVWNSAKLDKGAYAKLAEISIGKDSALVTGVAPVDGGAVNGALIVTPNTINNLYVPRQNPFFEPGSPLPGRALNSFAFKDATWTPLLNFESGNLPLIRGAVTKGIQVLISLADLSTMPAAASEQLFANMRFNALALGRPFIFASARFSALANSSGKIVAKTSLGNRPVTGRIEAPRPFDFTLYGRYGDWFAIACGAVVIVTTISHRLQRVNEKTRRLNS